uniref:Uncharacterized protein n=1 Tax=Phaeomonas parva TaxID=124430 RepID=A0A6U4KJQ2_9STRA
MAKSTSQVSLSDLASVDALSASKTFSPPSPTPGGALVRSVAFAPDAGAQAQSKSVSFAPQGGDPIVKMHTALPAPLSKGRLSLHGDATAAATEAVADAAETPTSPRQEVADEDDEEKSFDHFFFGAVELHVRPLVRRKRLLRLEQEGGKDGGGGGAPPLPPTGKTTVGFEVNGGGEDRGAAPPPVTPEREGGKALSGVGASLINTATHNSQSRLWTM